jgi:acyl-CoA oxidase
MEKDSNNTFFTRLYLIRNQLNGLEQNLRYYKSKFNSLDKFKTNSKFEKNSFIKTYFPFDNHIEFRQKIFNIIKNNPEFRTNPYQTEMSSSLMKDLLHRQMKILVKEVEKFIPFKELREDPIKFGMFMEAINHMDIGLSVRFAFHSILYYNSLVFLGTEKHKTFIEKSLSLEDIGCFALTELGHGSNVRNVKTTAHYDEKLKEFVLNTPSQEAYKWWIGGAGRTSNMAIIFAQLYTRGNCYGVHAFLVSIRDKGDNMPFPGVILGDTGPKVGNDSIDNGFIAFNNYRIHKDALLDKISSVDDEGNFSSSISNPDTRFATALGALSEGRVGVGLGSHVSL